MEPFVVDRNRPMQALGLFILVFYGLSIGVLLSTGANLHGAVKIWIPAAVWTPMSLFMMADISRVRIDPVAATVTRHKGVWPFVRVVARPFGDLVELSQDTIQRKHRRTGSMRDYNRLRLIFRDDEEWNLLEEFHTGKTVHRLGERISATTGLPLIEG